MTCVFIMLADSCCISLLSHWDDKGNLRRRDTVCHRAEGMMVEAGAVGHAVSMGSKDRRMQVLGPFLLGV